MRVIRITQITTLLAVLSLSLSAQATTVTPAEPTLPDSVDWLGYYNAVCGDLEAFVTQPPEQIEKIKREQPLVKQRLTYCVQARMSQRTFHYSVINAGINSAAFVACTAACISGATSGAFTFGLSKLTLDRACMAAGIAANGATLGLSIAGHIAAAKEVGLWFSENAMSLGSAAMSTITTIKQGTKSAEGAATSTTADKVEACLGAAAFGVQAGIATAGAVSARGPWGRALYQANEQRSKDKEGLKPNDPFSGPRVGANTAATLTAVDGSTARVGGNSDTTDACAQAYQTRDPGSTTQCYKEMAVAMPNVFNREFEETFQKIAKQDLGTFLRSNSDGMSVLQDHLGAQSASAIRAKMDQSVQLVLANSSSAQYASGGGGRAGGRGGSASGLGDPFADMAGLMKGLMPGGNKAKDGAGAGGIQAFGDRGPAAAGGAPDASADPRVNLFDRVSTAYRTQSARTGLAGSADAWSLPINRASHGLK